MASSKEQKEWPLYVRRRIALDKAESSNPAAMIVTLNGSEMVKAKDVIDWTYSVLTILDSKASALMRLNGVLIAAAAFLLGLFGREGGTILSTTNRDSVIIATSAFLSAVSIFLCLFVVNVSWNFLGKVSKKSPFNFAEEIESLDKTGTRRQYAYRAAWIISWVASVEFLAEFLMQSVYVTYFAIEDQKLWS